MQYKKRIYLSVALVTTLFACGNNNKEENYSPPITENIPKATANPVNQSLISGKTTILITFDTAMNPNSLNLSGDMAAEADGGTWDSTSKTNDSLTIGPSNSWSDGTKNLTINVKDENGYAIDSLNLTYQVDASLQILSVSPDNNSIITNLTPITVSYAESIETTSMTLGGDIPGESDGGVWGTTINTMDTLTISPTNKWSTGSKAVSISVNDLVGNNRYVELTYTVGQDTDGDGFMAEVNDCDDTNNMVNPGQTGYFTAPYAAGFDYNCNNTIEKKYPDLGATSPVCVVGWENIVPDCGQPGTYIVDTNCSFASRVQSCH